MQMRKIGLILIIVLSIVLAFGVIWYEDIDLEWVRAVGMILVSIGLPFGVALLFLGLDLQGLNKAKDRVRMAALALITLGVLLKFMDGLGANISVICGTFLYCFGFGPLGLKSAFLKWKPFANQWHDTTILSIFNFLGVNMVLLGALFRVMHWPYGNQLLILGGTLAGISLWGMSRKFGREVILRKQAEDKLKEKNREITDSIQYARRIQHNLMPRESHLEKVLRRLKRSDADKSDTRE